MAMATLTLPGDHVRVPSTSSVKLGPGLSIVSSSAADEGEELIATTPGILGTVSVVGQSARAAAQQKGEGGAGVSMWIESNGRRYTPALHDHVICQITNRGAESYIVSLFNSFTQATLPALAFEGATKRNKPNLRVGTLLYAQVTFAQRYAECELTCVDATTGKSNGFGELKTDSEEQSSSSMATKAGQTKSSSTSSSTVANVWPISCGLARSLLMPKHPLLVRLATHFPFEVAIGVNGFVWVRAQSVKHVIALGKVLERADAELDVETVSERKGQENETLNALQVAQRRGNLDEKTIARIVEPFK